MFPLMMMFYLLLRVLRRSTKKRIIPATGFPFFSGCLTFQWSIWPACIIENSCQQLHAAENASRAGAQKAG